MRVFRIFLTVACLAALCMAAPAGASTPDFGPWLKDLRREALGRGISQATVAGTLPDTLLPLERVIALDRKQPEKTKTFAEYLENVVTEKRVQEGRRLYGAHGPLLRAVGARYGVDPQFIVALWGIETNFGRNTGGYDVVNALATLAWDGRRGPYFRDELFKALKIVDEGHIAAEDMKGSWAGAMGQTQFMPSSFFNFAEDYDRDGRRDIWNGTEDVFASAANYLGRSGWCQGTPWGREVRLPQGFDRNLIGPDVSHPLQFWHDRGLRLKNGRAIPFEGAANASVIQPGGPGTTAYVIYENYRTILKWNRSTYFATAVGLLADRIKG